MCSGDWRYYPKTRLPPFFYFYISTDLRQVTEEYGVIKHISPKRKHDSLRDQLRFCSSSNEALHISGLDPQPNELRCGFDSEEVPGRFLGNSWWSPIWFSMSTSMSPAGFLSCHIINSGFVLSKFWKTMKWNMDWSSLWMGLENPVIELQF